MGTSTDTDVGTVVIEASKKFARAIAESSEFRNYEEAVTAFRGDAEAETLLTEFQEAQRRHRMMGSWGGLTPNDGKNIQELQKRVLENPILHRYFESQETVLVLLKALDVLLRSKMEFDFAVIAKPAGGCC
jgi:cell fate (sporulation/competence/biofilm development) regulator YlbF (YheA/YmcA/DUF963 family)